MNPLLRSLSSLTLLLASCDGTPPEPATLSDTTPLQLTAGAPTIVGKTVNLQVTLTDHCAVTRLTYALDDEDFSPVRAGIQECLCA